MLSVYPSPGKWQHLSDRHATKEPESLSDPILPSPFRPNQSPGPLKILYLFSSFQIYPFTLSSLSQSVSSVT